EPKDYSLPTASSTAVTAGATCGVWRPYAPSSNSSHAQMRLLPHHAASIMSTQRLHTTAAKSGAGAYVVIPFDPDEVWGAKERHYVTGSIDGHRFRGCLDANGPPWILPIGPAWMRDNDVGDGTNVEVILAPDGHQIDTLA